MRRLSLGHIAVLASFLLHGAVFAAAGAFWRSEDARARQPVYVELTMAELFSPVDAGGGGKPIVAPNDTESLPAPRKESGFSNRTEASNSAADPCLGITAGIGGSAGTGGTGGGSGTGRGTGAGLGVGTGTGPTRGPRVVDGTKPEYPDHARSKGWEGTVKLQILVSTAGRVEEVRVIGSSGYAELDQAAQRAIRSWLFSPALQKGVPVAAWATVPIVFDLR